MFDVIANILTQEWTLQIQLHIYPAFPGNKHGISHQGLRFPKIQKLITAALQQMSQVL